MPYAAPSVAPSDVLLLLMVMWLVFEARLLLFIDADCWKCIICGTSNPLFSPSVSFESLGHQHNASLVFGGDIGDVHEKRAVVFVVDCTTGSLQEAQAGLLKVVESLKAADETLLGLVVVGAVTIQLYKLGCLGNTVTCDVISGLTTNEPISVESETPYFIPAHLCKSRGVLAAAISAAVVPLRRFASHSDTDCLSTIRTGMV